MPHILQGGPAAPVYLIGPDGQPISSLTTGSIITAPLGRRADALSVSTALSTEDVAILNGLATQATLAAVLAKLSADPATQTTLAAVLAKLSADPATQTTLAAVLAKLSADPATQTTLAAILAKITSDPATQTTLAAILAKITSDPATQTTLASLLAVEGATTGAAVITDANGTHQQYLRGLVKLWIAGLVAGEAHIGEVGGNLIAIATELTRTNDTNPYVANDVVSDSTSATTMQALANAARVSGGSGYIVGIRISTDKKSIVPRFRVHFYNTNGATVAADNAQWKELYADASKRVGYWDMPAMTTGADAANSDMSRSADLTTRIPYTCAATSLYYVLETLDGFTPASNEKFTVTVFVDRN